MKKTLEFLRNFVALEAVSWGAVQELRQRFEAAPLGILDSIQTTPERTIQIIKTILQVVKKLEIDLGLFEPAHGIGHLTRDYVHALILARGGALKNSTEQHIGLIAGVFHDLLGCSLVDRYHDYKRVVRHAEASGLFLTFIGKSVGLTEKEILAAAYAMSAHTHYLKAQSVKCEDGAEREIQPYADMRFDQPVSCVWFPRWCDRLDVNGPAFVGRHYLTQAALHVDYNRDSQGFYDVKFADHMVPTLRSAEQIKAAGGKQTMREHMNMFFNSQNSQSAYGKFDPPIMVELRDAAKARLGEIIEAVDQKKHSLWCLDESCRRGDDNMICSPYSTDILEGWTKFLSTNIEPSMAGKAAAKKLHKMFLKLPPETQDAWANGFRVTMEQYDAWSQEIMVRLEQFSEDDLILPIIGDVREVIRRKK